MGKSWSDRAGWFILRGVRITLRADMGEVPPQLSTILTIAGKQGEYCNGSDYARSKNRVYPP
jgi:hypothetical protein